MAAPITSPNHKCLALLLLALVSPAFSLYPHSVFASPREQSPPAFDSLAKSATAAREAGHPADAIPLYRRAVELRSDWAEGWWYLGTLLYDADQFRDAIPAFQKLLALVPDAPPALNFLGLCEFETGEYDSALAHLEKASAADSQDDPVLSRVASYHLALLLNRAGGFERSLRVLSKNFAHGLASDQVIVAFGLALLHVPLLPREVDPSKDALLHSVGQLGLLVAQGHASQAVEGFPPLLKEYPDIPYFHSAYAAVLQAMGRANEAREQLQQESQLKPSSSAQIAARYANAATRARRGGPTTGAEESATNPSSAAEQNQQLAFQLFSFTRYADAIPALKAWLAQQPGSGTAWAMLGLCEFEMQDFDNALLHLQKGAALGLGGSPEAVRTAKYRLGLLLIRDGKFQEASTLLAPEAEGNSLSSDIQFALGLALLHKKLFPLDVPSTDVLLVRDAGEISLLLHNSKYDLAFPKLQKLIASHPAQPMLHYTYGLALASFSRYDEAEEQFLEESTISPKSEGPYVQLAFVQLQARQPAEALVSAQRAVQLAPGSAATHYVLGRSYLDLGKWENALRELQAAAGLNPGSPEVHFNLAKAYAKLNRPEDAAREREVFAHLNEEIEQRRGHEGSQAYGAAHTSSELSQSQTAPPSTPPQE